MRNEKRFPRLILRIYIISFYVLVAGGEFTGGVPGLALGRSKNSEFHQVIARIIPVFVIFAFRRLCSVLIIMVSSPGNI